MAVDHQADVDFWVRLLGTRIARVTNTHFTTGTGASQPIGVLTDAALGTTVASATEFTADELIDLEHSVDPAYRNNARFMLTDDALRVVKQLKGWRRPVLVGRKPGGRGT